MQGAGAGAGRRCMQGAGAGRRRRPGGRSSSHLQLQFIERDCSPAIMLRISLAHARNGLSYCFLV